MSRQLFEGIEIEPKPESRPPFWIGAERDGFTQFCADQMKVPIPVEDVTEREAQIIQRRQDVLATLVGLQQAKSNREIRSAVLVRRARN